MPSTLSAATCFSLYPPIDFALLALPQLVLFSIQVRWMPGYGHLMASGGWPAPAVVSMCLLGMFTDCGSPGALPGSAGAMLTACTRNSIHRRTRVCTCVCVCAHLYVRGCACVRFCCTCAGACVHFHSIPKGTHSLAGLCLDRLHTLSHMAPISAGKQQGFQGVCPL